APLLSRLPLTRQRHSVVSLHGRHSAARVQTPRTDSALLHSALRTWGTQGGGQSKHRKEENVGSCRHGHGPKRPERTRWILCFRSPSSCSPGCSAPSYAAFQEGVDEEAKVFFLQGCGASSDPQPCE